MKKIFVKFGIIALVIIGGIVACTKESTPVKELTSYDALSVNERQLIDALQKMNTNTERATPPSNTGKIIVADALGALEGGAKGFEWFAGNPWAVGIGAIVIGAASSYLASGIVQNPGGGGTGEDNPGNPFDYVGVSHNANLSTGFAGFNCPGNCNTPAYNQSETYVANNIDPIALQMRPLLFPGANQLYDLLPLLPSTSTEDFISLVAAQGLISPIQSSVLTEYTQNVLGLPSEDFLQASISFENTVLNSGISEQDKTVLMMGLSVARHSRGYWSPN